MLAAQLARRGINSLLIEGGGRVGLGIAYSTEEPAHVLNVRAEGMSAWPEEPGHFANQFGDPRGFAERKFFGRYLKGILEEGLRGRRMGHHRLRVFLDEGCGVVAKLDPDGVIARYGFQ